MAHGFAWLQRPLGQKRFRGLTDGPVAEALHVACIQGRPHEG